VKFLLYCIEHISGLQITFHKSKVLVVGASKDESIEIASWLNCRQGKLPLRYLGIPFSDRMMFASDMMDVVLVICLRCNHNNLDYCP
jgi:hypothetical protein